MLTGLGMYYSDSPVGIPAVMRHFLRNVDAMHQVWAFTQAWGSVRARGQERELCASWDGWCGRAHITKLAATYPQSLSLIFDTEYRDLGFTSVTCNRVVMQCRLASFSRCASYQCQTSRGWSACLCGRLMASPTTTRCGWEKVWKSGGNFERGPRGIQGKGEDEEGGKRACLCVRWTAFPTTTRCVWEKVWKSVWGRGRGAQVGSRRGKAWVRTRKGAGVPACAGGGWHLQLLAGVGGRRCGTAMGTLNVARG